MPQPSLERLRQVRGIIKRHWHEPTRKKREYQRMPQLF
jgi:hypothetical protein